MALMRWSANSGRTCGTMFRRSRRASCSERLTPQIIASTMPTSVKTLVIENSPSAATCVLKGKLSKPSISGLSKAS